MSYSVFQVSVFVFYNDFRCSFQIFVSQYFSVSIPVYLFLENNKLPCVSHVPSSCVFTLHLRFSDIACV